MYPLRSFQSDAISALKTHSHVICISPTGSGKSRIFQEVLKNESPRTLLISPLSALARQHLRDLEGLGIRAGFQQKPDAETLVWIAAPESLTRERVAAFRPQFLVVDECHCLWDWGQSFRTAFREVLALVKDLQIPRSLWLTATLPGEARRELRRHLPEETLELGRFELPKTLFLSFERVPLFARLEALCQWLTQHPGPGIIFVGTRGETVRVSRIVKAIGRPSESYHAGMSREERRSVEKRLSSSSDLSGLVIVATSAFGMGMHYPSLKWALLWQLPPTVLSLTQSLGRVGRGGQIAHAGVFWHPEDFRLLDWIVQRSDQNRAEAKALLTLLERPGCRVVAFDEYFSEVKNTANSPHFSANCARCDRCAAMSSVGFETLHH